MRKYLFIYIVLALLAMGGGTATDAFAQAASADLGSVLSRLKNNPRYKGRILGTHIVERNGRSIYEVRILRRDDKIILVYIDPETGGVVGDSQRNKVGNTNKRRKNNKRNRQKNRNRRR